VPCVEPLRQRPGAHGIARQRASTFLCTRAPTRRFPRSGKVRCRSPARPREAECVCGAESDPRNIAKSNIVKLRSFSTTVHTVEAAVAYKATDDDAS
jgi:hypothetical protein